MIRWRRRKASPERRKDMKKEYSIVARKLKSIGAKWEKVVYKYPTRGAQKEAFEEIGNEYTDLIRSGEIVDFMIELI
jgi:hypothetical protein